MSDETPPPPPTLDEIRSHPWETIAVQAKVPTCHEMADCLFKRASELETSGDEVGGRVHRFVGQLAFMHLEPGNEDAPLRPAIIMQTKRSASLDDYDEAALDLVQSLVGSTDIPSLRARFSDILWIARKDYRAATQAATDYLATFKVVDEMDKWVWDIDGLDRGMGIARALGTKKPLFRSYIDFIEGRLKSLEASCDDAYASHLLRLLAEHRAGDLSRSAEIAESIADRLEAAGSSFLAQDYYDHAARFLQIQSKPGEAQRVGQKKGESLVTQATACIDKAGQGYFSATHHLARGVECLRQARADENRVRELHKRLLEWQENATREMQSYSHEMDVSQLIENARMHMKGKSLHEAIFAMALGHPATDLAALRKRVIENAENFPLSTLFGGSMMARDGRVVAHRPSGFTTDEETKEKFIETEMFHQACQVDWNLRAQSYIDVCRREIWMTHRPRLQDLQFLVLQNPFIPRGYEPLFLKGIIAGFRGDFDITAHLLVPQVEEIIRHVLKRAGHVTSKLDAKLIQEQRLLGTLLSLPETVEIFGEDHVFELRGLLCEKFGYDLRNRLAHGFVAYGDCWGADVINLWWLVIRFLCFPIARKFKMTQDEAELFPNPTDDN